MIHAEMLLYVLTVTHWSTTGKYMQILSATQYGKKVEHDMNYLWHMKSIFITNFFCKYQKEKQKPTRLSEWSRLVAVDTLVLLHPAPPQRVHVFGSQPAVSGQRGLSQAQALQPADRVAVSHVPLRHISAPRNEHSKYCDDCLAYLAFSLLLIRTYCCAYLTRWLLKKVDRSLYKLFHSPPGHNEHPVEVLCRYALGVVLPHIYKVFLNWLRTPEKDSNA